MSNRTDYKRDSMQTVLGSSATNIDDLEILYLQNAGATSDQVNEAWYQVFSINLLGSGTGTVSVTAGTAAVVGVGTLFTTELVVGDPIKIGIELFSVLSITDDLNLTLSANHVAGAAGAAYLISEAPSTWNDAAQEFLKEEGATGDNLPDNWYWFWVTNSGVIAP